MEGEKSVLEVLSSSWTTQSLQATEAFLASHPEWADNPITSMTTPEMLRKNGSLQSNDQAIAVVEIPEAQPIPPPTAGYVLVLDEVRDPGNLGTIIRIADWYGIKGIVCAQTCADLYNPKVISASKGSFLRVPVQYTELSEYLMDAQNHEIAILGALMEGKSTHQFQFPKNGLIVMGNESNGIRAELQPLLTQSISIPRFGGAESLNVGVATAVICDRAISL